MSGTAFLDKLLEGRTVELVSLDKSSFFEIANRGRKPVKASLREPGDTPYYGANNIQDHVEGHTHDGEYVLIAEDGSKSLEHYSIQYVNGKFWANNHVHVVRGTDGVDTRFLYHSLCIFNFIPLLSGGGRAKLTKARLQEVTIPIPCPNDREKSLAIQAEIVRILDNFTTLEAELEAELEARRRQYQHYRDALLTFGDPDTMTASKQARIGWKTLDDLCLNVSSGGTPRATRPEYYGGDIPWLRTQEVRFMDIYDTDKRITEKGLAESSAKWIPENCVIVAISGATAARSAINKISLTTNQHCCNLQVDPEVANYRYVFHWVSKEYEKLKALGQGARSDLNSGIIKSYPIPVPYPDDPEKSIAEQDRIVSILDKFDALVNDLTDGLPAEINARRKQYEYYRDQLLTFPQAEEAVA